MHNLKFCFQKKVKKFSKITLCFRTLKKTYNKDKYNDVIALFFLIRYEFHDAKKNKKKIEI